MRSMVSLRLPVAAACLSLAACAGVKSPSLTGTGGTLGADAGAGAGKQDGPSFDFAPSADLVITPPHSICGDGVRSQDEACDDGNNAAGDGCAADCLTVDPGFSCTPSGQPCHRIARCGDGVAVLPELCDDGNVTAGDGCSDSCKIELGWKCSGSPSQCSHTTCGDKKVEGAEGCDDGNALPFDGCSADCKIEPGFMCKQPALGDTMLVPAAYRDFRAKMPTDFQPGDAMDRHTALTGMVMANLDADGKPVYVGNVANSLVLSAATFAEWYRDTAGVNHTTAGKLTLCSNGKGAYVNRYGPNCAQWIVTAPA